MTAELYVCNSELKTLVAFLQIASEICMQQERPDSGQYEDVVLLNIVACKGEFHQRALGDFVEGGFGQYLYILRDLLHVYRPGDGLGAALRFVFHDCCHPACPYERAGR